MTPAWPAVVCVLGPVHSSHQVRGLDYASQLSSRARVVRRNWLLASRWVRACACMCVCVCVCACVFCVCVLCVLATRSVQLSFTAPFCICLWILVPDITRSCRRTDSLYDGLFCPAGYHKIPSGTFDECDNTTCPATCVHVLPCPFCKLPHCMLCRCVPHSMVLCVR